MKRSLRMCPWTRRCRCEQLLVQRVWVVVKASSSALVLETAPPRGVSASRMAENVIQGAIRKEAASTLISSFYCQFFYNPGLGTVSVHHIKEKFSPKINKNKKNLMGRRSTNVSILEIFSFFHMIVYGYYVKINSV